jgi:hypothetical protein
MCEPLPSTGREKIDMTFTGIILSADPRSEIFAEM